MDMGLVWLAAIIALAVIETLTVQFVSIWFAGGAVCALIAYLLGADTTVQLVTFIIASAVLLVCTRPFVKKFQRGRVERTNADSLIGKTAVITQSIDNIAGEGEAKINGNYWTARSSDGSPVEKDSVVTIEKIDGVKLIVRK
ncbi:MAG: NfeD family protein [Firmicutes bacterium]|nr:NfeD family protein [Bacillota bacterium]